MIGVLVDAFEMSGRAGAIALVEVAEGMAAIGDTIDIAGSQWEVSNVDPVTYNSDKMRDVLANNKPLPYGLTLRGSKKADLTQLIGAQVSSICDGNVQK